MRSPGWTAGRRVAETAAEPKQQELAAAAAQALPTGLQSMTLTEARATAHDLHSPAWTHPTGTRGIRTIFDS